MEISRIEIALYRIFFSLVLGLIAIFHFYVLFSLHDITNEKPLFDEKFLQTIRQSLWVILLVALMIGEIFSVLGEIILFSIFRFSIGKREYISVYSKFLVNKKNYYIRSDDNIFTFRKLFRFLSSNDPVVHLSEINYSLGRALAGFGLYLFKTCIALLLYDYLKKTDNKFLLFFLIFSGLMAIIFLEKADYYIMYNFIKNFINQAKEKLNKISRIKNFINQAKKKLNKINRKLGIQLIYLFIYFIVIIILLFYFKTPSILIVVIIFLLSLFFHLTYILIPVLIILLNTKNKCNLIFFTLLIINFIIIVGMFTYLLFNNLKNKNYLKVYIIYFSFFLIALFYLFEFISLVKTSNSIILNSICIYLNQSNQTSNVENNQTLNHITNKNISHIEENKTNLSKTRHTYQTEPSQNMSRNINLSKFNTENMSSNKTNTNKSSSECNLELYIKTAYLSLSYYFSVFVFLLSITLVSLANRIVNLKKD